MVSAGKTGNPTRCAGAVPSGGGDGGGGGARTSFPGTCAVLIPVTRKPWAPAIRYRTGLDVML